MDKMAKPLPAYLCSLPERVLRSVSALAGGLLREAGEVALPARVRRTRLYQSLVDSSLRFLIEQVGQVFVEQAELRKKDKMPFHKMNRDWMKRAPAMITVLCDPRWMQAYPHMPEGHPRAALLEENAYRILLLGMGAAIQNMHLAAETLGLALAWMTGAGEADDMAKIKALLGVPEPIQVLMIGPVGYPYIWPKPRSRREVAQLIHWNRYDLSRFIAAEDVATQIRRREPSREDPAE